MLDPSKLDKQTGKVSRKSRKEFRRDYLNKDDALNFVFVIAIYVVGASFVALFIVRIIHFIYPNGWLTPKDIDSIDRFLFSGIAGALVGKHMDEVFKRPRN